MSKIEVSGFVRKCYKVLAENVANKSLEIMRQPDNLEIAIRFVSKKEIHRLNREIRSVDKPTDVLSFPATETKAGEIFDSMSEDATMLVSENGYVHFGDMALCLPVCKKQAKEYGTTIKQEIKKLVIHSCLHLMGYDHIEDDDYKVMNRKEKELDKKIKI